MKHLLIADLFQGFRIAVVDKNTTGSEQEVLSNVRIYEGKSVDQCARIALESETRDDIRVQLTRFMTPTDVSKVLPKDRPVFLLVPGVWLNACGHGAQDRVFKVSGLQYTRAGIFAKVTTDFLMFKEWVVHVEARDARFV